MRIAKHSKEADLLELTHNPCRGQRCVRDNAERSTGAFVDDVETPKAATAIQRITHEIERPGVVHLGRYLQWLALAIRQTLLVRRF